MTRFEALVSLNMVLDIGSVRLARLLEVFGTPQDILEVSKEQLMQVEGVGPKIAAKICALTQGGLDKELALAKKQGVSIITIDDAGYPESLKTIPGAPIVLYIKGKLQPQDSRAIAIVGSRRASLYGLTNAEQLSYELAKENFTVVSGMARGIDTCAHRGALKAGGRTIAVFGSGFNNIYPSENAELAERIAEHGAVVTELPFDTPPFKQNFPRRNRVISGLSLGTVVVEAARNSGALITADFALEQGREVFALPGKIDSDNAFGTNGLIKQGAKLVSCAEDILEEYEELREARNPQKSAGSAQKTGFGPDESLIFSCISSGPIAMDELADKTNMDIPAISAILLTLRLKKLIKELPGHYYASAGSKAATVS